MDFRRPLYIRFYGPFSFSGVVSFCLAVFCMLSSWLGRIPVAVDDGVLDDQERLFYHISEEVGFSFFLLGGFLFSDLVVSSYVA